MVLEEEDEVDIRSQDDRMNNRAQTGGLQPGFFTPRQGLIPHTRDISCLSLVLSGIKVPI